MSKNTCLYTYVRGKYAGNKCGKPATVFAFCIYCSKKKTPDGVIAGLKLNGVSSDDYQKSSEIISSSTESEEFINFVEDGPGMIAGAILDQAMKEENSSKEDLKVYFSGEFDSNQTDFERMSNRLEIGVIARSKRVAIALLMLLRMSVDNYPSYVYFLADDFEGYKEFESIDPKSVPKKLLLDIVEKCTDDSYLSSFKLADEFVVELYGPSGKEIVKKRLHEVDLWTITRFENE